jgi:hypothetical protein
MLYEVLTCFTSCFKTVDGKGNCYFTVTRVTYWLSMSAASSKVRHELVKQLDVAYVYATQSIRSYDIKHTFIRHKTSHTRD